MFPTPLDPKPLSGCLDLYISQTPSLRFGWNGASSPDSICGSQSVLPKAKPLTPIVPLK